MTYVTDPIGDLLTRMRNAQRVRKESCSAPWSRIKEELCTLLKKEGWIENVEIEGEDPKKQIRVVFSSEKPSLEIKRVSKPGRRVYEKSDDLKPVLSGYGVAILTTSKGLMTDIEARKEGVGGEVLCTIA